MTKEELEKEAEEWVKNNNYPYSNCPNIEKKLKQAYLAGAEPREKRISELEAQIEKMKCWCNCKNYLSCFEECCRKYIPFENCICYNCKKWELRR